MVHDDKPRNTWKLAVIEEIIRGNDGLVRAANIRTKNGRTNRPITKLYPLEVSAENKGERKQSDSIEESDMRRIVERNSLRPKRTAALKARDKIAKWVDELCPAPEDVE